MTTRRQRTDKRTTRSIRRLFSRAMCHILSQFHRAVTASFIAKYVSVAENSGKKTNSSTRWFTQLFRWKIAYSEKLQYGAAS